MKLQWSMLLIVGLFGVAGCQNCGKAAREAEEAARVAAEEAAATEKAAAEAQAEAERMAAEARAAAEREAAEAAARAEAEEARRNHIVQRGDCLWYIAADRYGDGARWGEIYRANATQISDPDLIYPDQVFQIP